MISTQLVSPFHSTATTAVPPGKPAEETTPQQVPQDVVSPGRAEATEATAAAAAPSRLSAAKRAGAALMIGVAVLGSGVLAPATAQAQPYGYGYGYNAGYGYHHHHNGGGGNRAAAVIGGIIIGTAIGAIAAQNSAPAPVYVPVDPGFNGMACDGQYHHFDSYGNVADQSGNYRLFINPYTGGCQAGPARY